MQNENAGKTVEQIAAEYMELMFGDAIRTFGPKHVEDAYKDGLIYSQQSQPMWREIEGDWKYEWCMVKSEEKLVKMVDWCAEGSYLLHCGYTHYLSSEDLLRLPIAQSK